MTTPSTAVDASGDEPGIVVGPREQLFHLLAEAAEIEHTLMCSYLYAVFSLKRAGTGNLSRAEGAAVERWRKTILAVAIEEMVHLLLVANLSIAIGGRPHFGRPNFPVAPGYFPSGVVVKLTPFSDETLQHMIFLERPRGVERSDGAGFEHSEYEREEPYLGLMPSAQDYTTVGRLYEAIRLNLASSATRLGERQLFMGTAAAQVGPHVVDLAGVTIVNDLKSALRAIDTIVEQGEGSADDRGDSHYQRFRAIESELRELRAVNPAFEPAWPAAESPVMRRPPEPEEKVFVDHPSSAPVLDFGNAVYNLLLRCLVQAFGQNSPHGAMRHHLDAAVELMHILEKVAGALVQMPASEATPGVNAGITFTMLRSVEPFLVGRAETVLLIERLKELRNGSRSIALRAPELSGVGARIDAILRAYSGNEG